MRRVRADLEAAGLRVWVDETRLSLAIPARQRAARNALADAACLVALLTPNARSSDRVQQALTYACDHAQCIFPVLAAGDERTSLPYFLRDAGWVDIRFDYYAAMNVLIPTIQHLLAADAPCRHDQPPLRRAEPPTRLNSLGLLDWLRLLVWSFIAPRQLARYRRRYGSSDEIPTRAWVVATLTWLPVFIPTAAFALGFIPTRLNPLPHLPPAAWTLLLLLCWVTTAQMGQINLVAAGLIGASLACLVTGMVAFDLAYTVSFTLLSLLTIGTSLGVAVGLVGGLAGGMIYGIATVTTLSAAGLVAGVSTVGAEAGVAGVMVGMSVSTWALAIANIINHNLSERRPSRMSLLVLPALLGAFGLLVWLYLFGGWAAV